VRGNGELGEQWRLAGKDANKPNTWRDLIACAGSDRTRRRRKTNCSSRAVRRRHHDGHGVYRTP
jgi:prolyl oligopeptidase PreP (S9A serine peptidase family)